MAWTKVQTGRLNGASSGTTYDVTFLSTPTPGNLVVCKLTFWDNTAVAPTVTVVDGNAVALTKSTNSPSNGEPLNAGFVWIFWYVVPASGHVKFTPTFSKALTVSSMYIDEFAPPSGTPALAQDAAGTGTTGNITGPSLTTTAGNLLVAVGMPNHSITGTSAPWTASDAGVSSFDASLAAHVLNAAGGSVAAAFTVNTGGPWDSMMAEFNTGGGGGGGSVKVGTSRMFFGLGT